MDLTSVIPKLSVDVDMFEELMTNRHGAMTKLASTDQFQKLLELSKTFDVKSILPSLNLEDFPAPKKTNDVVESSYAFTNPHSRPMHTLPKSVEDFKNVFPNFKPPEKTPIVPPLSSLEARRPLHEDTKTELSPMEKMLDENYKQMHSTIQQVLSAARATRVKFEDNLLNGPIHPYQKLIYKYLGSDFVAPSIHDIAQPQNFCPMQCNEKLLKIKDTLFKNTMTQFQHLTAGIGKIEDEEERKLMEGLGHAFATLSATPGGTAFVVDHEKTANYLEFAEMVRNIPIKEIVQNPVQTAQKVITRFIDVLTPLETNFAVDVENNIELEKQSDIKQPENKKHLNEETINEIVEMNKDFNSSHVATQARVD